MSLAVRHPPTTVNGCTACGARDYATTTRPADVSPTTMREIALGPPHAALCFTLCAPCRLAVAAALATP